MLFVYFISTFLFNKNVFILVSINEGNKRVSSFSLLEFGKLAKLQLKEEYLLEIIIILHTVLAETLIG